MLEEIAPRGPGVPWRRLWASAAGPGRRLPSAWAALYDPWPLPDPGPARPVVLANFVASWDGRVTFGPSRPGGGVIAEHDPGDRWLMGLVRARADAVVVGGSSLAAAGRHVWTPAAVCPAEAAAYAALRTAEGRAPAPLLVIVARSGAIWAEAPALADPNLPVLVVTTPAGTARARAAAAGRPWVDVVERPAATAAEVLTLLRERGVRHALVEAGPRLFGAWLAAGAVDVLFLTLSPRLLGAGEGRLALVEGVGFPPEATPRLRLEAVHQAGDFLYLRAAVIGKASAASRAAAATRAQS